MKNKLSVIKTLIVIFSVLYFLTVAILPITFVIGVTDGGGTLQKNISCVFDFFTWITPVFLFLLFVLLLIKVYFLHRHSEISREKFMLQAILFCILILLQIILFIGMIVWGGHALHGTLTMSPPDTTADTDQTSTDTDITDEPLLFPAKKIEELVTPDPDRPLLASSDMLAAITKGTTLHDVLETVGMPQRIETMNEMISYSEFTSFATPAVLPCLVYETAEEKNYLFSIRTYKREDEKDWRYEVYHVYTADRSGTLLQMLS